jgi:hypothetical protein
MGKELVNYFKESNIDWKIKTTNLLVNFVIFTQQYLTIFNFRGADGLDNMRSNIHTLLNEATRELKSRKITL